MKRQHGNFSQWVFIFPGNVSGEAGAFGGHIEQDVVAKRMFG
ncbi:MAG: hypothetical protein ACOX19_01980 [Fermentimonas sp.]|jgi:hypothetical protein